MNRRPYSNQGQFGQHGQRQRNPRFGGPPTFQTPPGMHQQYQAHPQQYQAHPQQYQAHPQQYQAHPQQYQAHPQQYQAHPQQYQAHPQQYQAHPQQYQAHPQQYQAHPQQYQAHPQHYQQQYDPGYAQQYGQYSPQQHYQQYGPQHIADPYQMAMAPPQQQPPPQVDPRVLDYYQRDDLIARLHCQKFEFNLEMIMWAAQYGYVFTNRLGVGAYAGVYGAIPIDEINSRNKNPVAIKVNRIKPSQIRAVVNELNIMSVLMASPHPNVINFMNSFGRDDGLLAFIVMGMAARDLHATMVRRNNLNNKVGAYIPQHGARHLIRGIAEGILHLKGLRISHGDLKMENILIFYTGEGTGDESDYMNMIPKITDFNNSKYDPSGAALLVDHPRCTLLSAAPETYPLYEGVPIDLYDMFIADVFSVGTILLTMLLGGQPFEAYKHSHKEDQGILMLRINALKRSSNFVNHLIRPFSQSVQRLLLRALEIRPLYRITIEDFLNDKWFSETLGTYEVELLRTKSMPQDRYSNRKTSF